MRKRSFWIWTAVLVVVIGGGLVWRNQSQQSAAVAQEEAQVETAEAFIGNLSASASASGNIQPQQTAQLALGTTGVVLEVAVEVGDQVSAGQLLVQLDTAALERAVQNAEQALIIQQNNLTSLTDGATAAQIASAEAAVTNAQAQLDNLLAGGADQVAAAEASLRTAEANVSAAAARLAQAQAGGSAGQQLQAQNALEAAQTAYTQAEEQHRATFDCTYNSATAQFDCVGGSEAEQAARIGAQQAYANLLAAQDQLELVSQGGNTSGIAAAQAGLAQASANRDAAQARYDLAAAGPTAAQIAAAQANVAQAQAQRDKVLAGPTAEQIAIAEAAVAQAQLGLDLARYNLTQATLTAPFDGVVTAVYVTKGELASGLAVELVNLNSLEVVLAMDEIDIGTISLGQQATIVVESFPDVELQGEVVAIAPKNTVGAAGGLISYAVNLTMGDHDLLLRPNMTASANLVTAERNDVLLVPNRALIINRETNSYRVQVQQGETFVSQTVTVGLRDGRYTQITSGLNEGDVVLIGDVNAPRIQFGPPQDGEE